MNRPYTVVAVGTALTIVVVALIAAISPELLRTSSTMRIEDFGAYWTATKVALDGGNPYDEKGLLPLQQQIEPERILAGAAWSPPWAFVAHAPFLPMEFAAARWIWRFFQIGTIFAAVAALWRVYNGPPGKLIWGWSAALMWYPTLQTLGLGQHSNFALLGVAGWLACQTSGRPFAAGAFLALVLVKPQNLYLLGLIGIVWVVNRREWRVAAGAVSGTIVFTALTLALNPRLFQDYLEAFRSRPPTSFLPPTIGMMLRMMFGESRFWLMFLPPLAGVIWGAWYYARHRATWNWAEQAPVIVLVSCITSPYGWVYDQILLLVPVVAVLAPAAHRPEWLLRGVVVVAALTGLCLILHGAGFREVTFVWFAPLCLVLYLVVRARLRRADQPFSNNS